MQYSFDIINKIFKLDNRDQWYTLLEPYILKVDKEDRKTLLGDKDSDDEFDSDWYAFIPEELKSDFPWKFNIGDIVTDGNCIMKIINLPLLDPRSEKEFDPMTIDLFGNRYNIIRIDKDGNDIEKDNPCAYLHQEYNQDQIHLASKEEIEKLLK